MQSDMVRWSKRNHLRWLGIIGVVLAVAGAFAGLLLGQPPGTRGDFRWTPFVLYSSIGVGVMILQQVLAARYDPNGKDHDRVVVVADERAITAEELDGIHAEEEKRQRREEESRPKQGKAPRRQIRRWHRPED